MAVSLSPSTGEGRRRRAKEVYGRRITAQLEAENADRYVALDLNTEDFEIGDDFIEVVHRLKGRRPDAQVFSFRVGDGGRPVDRFHSVRPEGLR
jgi:hypothetical protein